MDPLVSVIIPTHNRLAYLKQAVASVNTQTYKNIELIIVDDGSTDKTLAWIKEQGLNYITLEHNGFPGFVRNRGAEAAKGEYLCFLDSDDLWKPTKLEKQIDFFKNNPHFVLCHTREIWNRNDTIVSQIGQKHRRAGNIFKDALAKCIIGPSTVMINREVFFKVGTFHESLEIAEDYELWLRLTAQYEVGYIDEPLVEKRGGHKDQLSQKYGHIEIFRIWALLLNIQQNIFNDNQLKASYAELSHKCSIYALGCAKRRKYSEYYFYRQLAKHFYIMRLNLQSLLKNKK